MVGIGTVLADNPLLTCRLEGGVDPIRVVCDTTLKIPLDAQIVQTAHEVPTLIATCSADAEKRAALEARGCELVDVARASDGHLDLGALVVGHVGLDLLNGLLDLSHGVDILLDQGGVLLTGLVQAVDQCAELTL